MFRRHITLLLVLAICTLSLVAQNQPVRRYGLFVGANDGGEERVTLRWAVSDARRVAGVMQEAGGIQPMDSYVLSNPTSRDLELQFEHIGSRISSEQFNTRRSELIFYYSGHSDETGIMLGSEHMSYGALRQAIQAVSADVTIAILDSCASGAFTRLKGGSFAQPFVLDDGSELSGHAFLSSSSADEASQESDSLGSSFFTHYLVSGLRGAADTSDDQVVTLDEVYLYAREQTLQRTMNTLAGPQNASFDFQLSGTGSLVLTNLAVVDSGVILDPSLAGILYIAESAGRIVAEVDKAEGVRTRIALPAGAYKMTLQGEGRNYVHDVVLTSGRFTNVAGRDFRVAFLDRNRVRGDEQPTTPVSVTLLPGQDIVNAATPTSVNFSFGLLVGDAFNVRGGQMSTFVSRTQGDLTGVQLASVGNNIGGDLTGVQYSAVFNRVEGGSEGAQLTGVFNRVEGSGSFLQAAGIANLAGAEFIGVQSAGVANVTAGPVTGAQFAGVYNQAGGLAGAQFSLVNIGGDVHGAQIGLVNIGKRVTGAQIGLINISENMRGVPLGLINIIDSGIHDFSLWWEGDEQTWLGIQNGSNFFYTLGYAGFTRGGEWSQLEGLGLGAGVGVRITNRPFYFDVDLSWKMLSAGADSQQRFASLFDRERGAAFPSARLLAGFAIGDGFGWYFGGTFDIEGAGSRDSIGYFDGRRENSFDIGSGATTIHPVFVTGFKL